jgi:hypothetical protein
VQGRRAQRIVLGHLQLGALHVERKEVGKEGGPLVGEDGAERHAADRGGVVEGLAFPPAVAEGDRGELPHAAHRSIVHLHEVDRALLLAYAGVHERQLVGAVVRKPGEVAGADLHEHALPAQLFVEHVGVAEADAVERTHFDIGAVAESGEDAQEVAVFHGLRGHEHGIRLDVGALVYSCLEMFM